MGGGLELSAAPPDLQGGERGWESTSTADDLIDFAYQIKLQEKLGNNKARGASRIKMNTLR